MVATTMTYQEWIDAHVDTAAFTNDPYVQACGRLEDNNTLWAYKVLQRIGVME